MHPMLRPPLFATVLTLSLASTSSAQAIGAELGLQKRLLPGEEYTLSPQKLFQQGRDVFVANWTVAEGQGRPLTKGTGAALSDPSDPLVFPRSMNRVSGPDANSCAGCHNFPISGGAGDIVTNVFVLGQRFDFATFDSADGTPTKGDVDELGNEVTLQSVGNSRQTVGMFGSGFIEMLARQITSDLQAIRNTIPPGGSAALKSKGISFGTLSRDGAGAWITTAVEGLPAPSLASAGAGSPPNLLVRPFHQAGAVISLRQFTNNAMNHHHGIQSVERFGAGLDPDGDGIVDELSIADVSAASVYQAALDVPGRVLPEKGPVREAVRNGEHTFVSIGCSSCHVPSLPLDGAGWVYTEPNPFNPAGNLLLSDAYVASYGPLAVDLTDDSLPGVRPKAKAGIVEIAAFTDFKLHDITSGPGDPNVEPLDMHAPGGSVAFFAGNSRFLSAKLWGAASQMPYYHHGEYTTLRQAVEAHAGEATGVMALWNALTAAERDEVIEFLKSLQILPSNAKGLFCDANGKKVVWPSFPWIVGQDVPPLP
jgi:hypothetical protein